MLEQTRSSHYATRMTKPTKCPRCEQLKPPEGFYRSRTRKSGLSGYCRECAITDSIARRDAMSPAARADKDRRDHERTQARKIQDPDYAKLIADRRRAWVVANPAKIEAWTLARRATKAAYMKEWRAGNRERAREISRAAHRKSKEIDPDRERIVNAVRNNNARAKRSGIPGRLTYADMLEAIARFGASCAYCGATRCHLDFDHLDSMRFGGHNIPSNIVPACRICNAGKWAKPLAQFCAERGLDEAAIRARAAS